MGVRDSSSGRGHTEGRAEQGVLMMVSEYSYHSFINNNKVSSVFIPSCQIHARDVMNFLVRNTLIFCFFFEEKGEKSQQRQKALGKRKPPEDLDVFVWQIRQYPVL